MDEAEFGAGDIDDAPPLQLLRRALDLGKRTIECLGDTGQRRAIAPEGKSSTISRMSRGNARARVTMVSVTS